MRTNKKLSFTTVIGIFTAVLFLSMLLNANLTFSSEVTEQTKSFLEANLEPEKTNLIFFYSKRCPHCEKVLESKVLDNLNTSEYHVIKVQVDDPEYQMLFLDFCEFYKNKPGFRYGVVPTLIVIKDNSDLSESEIFHGDSPIINYVNKLIEGETVGDNTSNSNLSNEMNKTQVTLINKTDNADAFNSENNKNQIKLTPLRIAWLVLVTALADSINPCIMSVLALLISQLMLFKAKKRIKKYSIIYIITIYISYFIIGVLLALGLNAVITKTSTAINSAIGFYVILAVAIIVIFAGAVNIKDFFAYGKGISFSLSKKSKERVIKLIQKLSLPSIIALGFIITLIEFPCSGIMYAGFISLLALNHISFLGIITILIVYNFIFVLPLILIVYFVLKGKDISDVDSVRMKYRKIFRLIMGLVLIALGIYLLKIIF